MGLWSWMSGRRAAAQSHPAPPAPLGRDRSSRAPREPLDSRPVFNSEVAHDLSTELRRRIGTCDRPEERQLYGALLKAVRHEGVTLPVIPEVVLEIERVIADPDGDIESLMQAIAREPAVATKIVGVAGSPAYSTMESPKGLKGAIKVLGFRETRNIVLAILGKSQLFRVHGFEAEATELYQRTLASALAAQLLAVEAQVDQDQAFLAGLVHDLGSVVLLSSTADVYRHSKGTLKVDPELIAAIDPELHARISALTAETWSLSPVVVGAILHHHDPSQAPPESQPLAGILKAADEVADRVRGTSHDEAPIEEVEALDVRTTDIVASARISFQAYEGVAPAAGNPLS